MSASGNGAQGGKCHLQCPILVNSPSNCLWINGPAHRSAIYADLP